MIFSSFLMADLYVICFLSSSSRVAGMVKEAFLTGCWELHNFLCFRVAVVPEESLELDFALLWDVKAFALWMPYKR